MSNLSLKILHILLCRFRRGILQIYNKFIASVPAQYGAIRKALFHGPGKVSQTEIPNIVTVPVIVVFEIIYINKDKDARFLTAQFTFQSSLEGSAVHKTGQWVGCR